MIIIINGNRVNSLEWTVLKGLSSDKEDFARSKVMLFAVSETNKIPLAIESKDDGCIKATIPSGFEDWTGLTEQTYDTELIWIKNGRDVNRTYQYNVFKVDTNSTALKQTIYIKSTALVYGYDGLSAYEIAMMKAENPKSENEWLRDLLSKKADKNGNSSEDFSANNIIVQNHVIAQSIKSPNDRTRHGIMVPTARTDAEYMLTTSDGKRYGCSLFYSDKKIKLLGDNRQELSYIEAYNKLDTDDIVEELAYRIGEKADVPYVNNNFATKTSVYTKSEVDSALGLKANKTALESAEYKILEAETDIESLQHRMNLSETDIDNIKDTIPSLATKEFVNSSISTNTATFRGSYNQKTSGIDCAPDASHEDVASRIPLVVLIANNNDYVFVLVPVNQSPYDIIERVDRYKYVVDQNSERWEFEYALNNSGFTAEQWAAINSLITKALTDKIIELPTNAEILELIGTKLSLSGGKMTGVIDLDDHALLVRNKNNESRNGIQYVDLSTGILIGNSHMNTTIQSTDSNLKHRKGDIVYPILDGSNVKTINNLSIVGAGNIDIDDAFKVVYGVTPMADVVNAYLEGKHLYAVNLNLDENFTTANVFMLYVAQIDDINHTDHTFAFSQYLGNGSDISWFELTSDGYSEIYFGTIATLTDLTRVLSDYTPTSDLTTLLDAKQNLINSSHKLSADVIDDSSTTNKFVTSSDKTTWNTVTEKAPLPFVVICGINPSNEPYVRSTLDEIWAAHQNGKNIRVYFAKAGGVSFEDDATLLLDGSRNCVVHTVHNGTHHIVTIYDDNGTTKLSYEEAHDSDKQDVISDLSTIRSGAAAGATAYQKPQSGIPASDIASGVIPDISNLANKSGSLSQDFAAKSLSVLGRGTSNGIKLYRSDGQIPYGRIIMESDLVSSGIDYMLPTTGVAEQSAVVLATKDSVDAKYTKPSSGIPASDIAAGVIPDVSNFITNSVNNLVNYYLKSETYTQSEVDALISNMQKFHYEIYASLQDITTPATNVLYLIGPSGSGSDKYEEYVYANNSFTKIGDTSIDLSNYVTTQALNTALADYVTSTDLATLLGGKQDTLVSGTNIKTINNTSVLGSGDISTEVTTNRETSISASADNSHYPTSKAVYDYVSTELSYKLNVISDLSAIRSGAESGATAYQKPTTGIPSTDFDSTVQTSLGKADTAYQLPTNGIPATDLESAVLTSLGKADTAVQPATLNSYLQKSGGQMSGDLNMNSNGLLVRAERNGIKFTGSGSNEGVYVGNGSMRLFLEADSTLDVKHKKGNNYYAMLDEGNTKTINSSSLYGSGDLLLYTVSDVKANLEAMFTALVSAGVIQNYTLTDPASGSKTFGFSFT